jgi:hypothetical protein
MRASVRSVASRIVRARSLWNPGQQCGLRQRQLVRLASEVRLAGPRHTHHVVAERKTIEVLLQDLVFGHDPLERECARGFERLGPHDRPVATVRELHELFGDGRCTTASTPREQIGPDGAKHRRHIDPVMRAETGVFGGHDGVDEPRRDLRERHPTSVHTVDASLSQRGAVPIDHTQPVVGPRHQRRIEQPAAHHEHRHHRGDEHPARRESDREDHGDANEPADHGAATVSVAMVLRARNVGDVSASRLAGGTTKVPGFVARIP